MSARLTLIAALVASLPVAATAQASTPRPRGGVTVSPYLTVDTGVFSDLRGSRATEVFTDAGAGVRIGIDTQRTQLSADISYQHRFGWGGLQGDSDRVEGILRGRHQFSRGFALDAGALATRVRADVPGLGGTPLIGDVSAGSQLISTYAAPSFNTQVGSFDVLASARAGWTRLDNRTGLAAPAFDGTFDYGATVRVGQRVNNSFAPVGWNVTASYDRSDGEYFDTQFEQKSVRAEFVRPVSPTLAAVASVGYETTRSSQADALRDAAGAPVRGADGRFVADPVAPRLLSYDESGFIWDVGVMWRPSDRTQGELRVGQRYGGTSVAGSLSWRPDQRYAVQVAVFDGLQTFGRQINGLIATLPTGFDNGFGNDTLGQCLFGGSGAPIVGGCTTPVLAAIAGGTYRARGVNVSASRNIASSSLALGAGYIERRFFLPIAGVAGAGYVDRTLYASLSGTYRLGANQALGAALTGSWYNSGEIGARDVTSLAIAANYYRSLTRRLQGTASIGLYTTQIDGLDSTLVGNAQVGARYAF